jgi:hypothetical protein
MPLWCKIYLIKKNKKMGAVCGPFILAKAWIKKKFNLTNYIDCMIRPSSTFIQYL